MKVLDAVPGLVAILQPGGQVEATNRRWREFHGRDTSHIDDWVALLQPAGRDAFLNRWRDAAAGRQPFELDVRVCRSDGAWRWMCARVEPQLDDSSEMQGWGLLVVDIDDRWRADEAVRAREQSLRLILDSIPGMVHTLTPSGEVEHVNKAVTDFFGMNAEELRDWSGVTHPDDIERVGAILLHSLQTGLPFDVESRGRRADGVYRWFHARGLPLRDAEGRIVRWYNALTDVDDRKRAVEALRESEQNLRLMVQSIPGLICTNTPTGEVDHVNERLLQYTGRTLDELRDWAVVVHPDDHPTVAELWQRSVQTGAPFNVEVRVQRADGIYRWFQCNGLPLRDAHGQVLRWYNLLTDIEDGKEAETRVRAREKELELIVNTLPACVWGASAEGAVLFVNDRYTEFTGAMVEEVRAAPFERIHPDDCQHVTETWLSKSRAGLPYLCQYRQRCADGSYRWIQSMAQLSRDDRGRPARWYGLFIDVHERVVMEEALRVTRARLARATQVATVGELSAAIAHEVSQPLAAVLAHAHACQGWLGAEPPNLARALVSLERIVRDGRGAADVVQRVRALYRQVPPDVKPLVVNDVIDELYRLIDVDARNRSIKLHKELAEPLPAILADRVQIQQVLANLTRNAFEAMDGITGAGASSTSARARSTTASSWTSKTVAAGSATSRPLSSPSSRPSPTAWVWGWRSAVPSWKHTAAP